MQERWTYTAGSSLEPSVRSAILSLLEKPNSQLREWLDEPPIMDEVFMALLFLRDEPIALAVLRDDAASTSMLFVTTRNDLRGKGYARRVIRGLLSRPLEVRNRTVGFDPVVEALCAPLLREFGYRPWTKAEEAAYAARFRPAETAAPETR